MSVDQDPKPNFPPPLFQFHGSEYHFTSFEMSSRHQHKNKKKPSDFQNLGVSKILVCDGETCLVFSRTIPLFPTVTWSHFESVKTLTQSWTRWIYVFTTAIAYSHVTSHFVRHFPTSTGAIEKQFSVYFFKSFFDGITPGYFLLAHLSPLPS